MASIAAVESVVIDVAFAVLMAPVDAFHALLELFDTTEYPSASLSVKPSSEPASKSSAGSDRSLGAYWDKYTQALSLLWERVVAYHYAVAGYLAALWTAAGDFTLWFHNSIEEGVTWAYNGVYPLIEITGTVLYHTGAFTGAVLRVFLMVVLLSVSFLLRYLLVVILCGLCPPLPLLIKGFYKQAWILAFLVLFFPYLWTFWAAYAMMVTLQTPGFP